MKKILYTLLAGAMALSSCSKSDDMPTAPQSEATTFILAVDGASTRTISTVTPARYIMEVYSEDGTTAENVFENNTKNHAEITTGSAFTVTLDKTKAYTCLFWADYDTDNTSGAFNAANLKAISLNTGKEVTEAYHAKVAVAKGKNPAVAVTLKRAVAKITLTETAIVKTTDDIALKFSNIYPTFSVLDGTATDTVIEWTKTITPSATTGTIGTLYFFAKTDKELSYLKFAYAAATEKTVSNIPVQQNHATNIKGEYSNLSSFTFTVTADDEWNTSDNNVNFPKGYKVGDLYPSATAPIGVVFYVDATDPSYDAIAKTSVKGKIVSLDEATDIQWSRYIETTNATSETDGAANTAKIFALDNYGTSAYPAFVWCATKNITAAAGIKWYIPAILELKNEMYTNKTILNTVLESTAGAVKISTTDYYWSSTEREIIYAYRVTFFNGTETNGDKYSNINSLRLVSAF